jgi:hypothetical protein
MNKDRRRIDLRDGFHLAVGTDKPYDSGKLNPEVRAKLSFGNFDTEFLPFSKLISNVLRRFRLLDGSATRATSFSLKNEKPPRRSMIA